MISSIFLNGALGLVGGIAQKIADYKTKKLELELLQKKTEAEIQLRRVDAEIMAQEWQARTKVAEIEAEAKISVEDSKAFAASYELEPKQYGILFLDILRGSIRPLLTVYLVVLTSIAYSRTNGGIVNPDILVMAILDMTSMCVGWWFGSRGSGKK